MFLIYMVLRPAPVLIIAPSSTSFFSADSTEELPRLGHESFQSTYAFVPTHNNSNCSKNHSL